LVAVEGQLRPGRSRDSLGTGEGRQSVNEPSGDQMSGGVKGACCLKTKGGEYKNLLNKWGKERILVKKLGGTTAELCPAQDGEKKKRVYGIQIQSLKKKARGKLG